MQRFEALRSKTCQSRRAPLAEIDGHNGARDNSRAFVVEYVLPWATGAVSCAYRWYLAPILAEGRILGQRRDWRWNACRTLCRRTHIISVVCLRTRTGIGTQCPKRQSRLTFGRREVAGKPHAGICAGGCQQSPFLPRPELDSAWIECGFTPAPPNPCCTSAPTARSRPPPG